MTTPRIKVDNMLVKDHNDWAYKNAFIVVRDIDANIKSSAKSKEGADGYDENSVYEITYTGNYWMDKETQEAGKASRPLGRFVDVDMETIYEINKDGECTLDDNGYKIPTGDVIPAHTEWSEVHTVDVEHSQSLQVLGSSMSGTLERNRLIELDVMRKFALDRG